MVKEKEKTRSDFLSVKSATFVAAKTASMHCNIGNKQSVLGGLGKNPVLRGIASLPFNKGGDSKYFFKETVSQDLQMLTDISTIGSQFLSFTA